MRVRGFAFLPSSWTAVLLNGFECAGVLICRWTAEWFDCFVGWRLFIDRKPGTGAKQEKRVADLSPILLESRHIFQENTYRKITPCDVCSQILKGTTKLNYAPTITLVIAAHSNNEPSIRCLINRAAPLSVYQIASIQSVNRSIVWSESLSSKMLHSYPYQQTVLMS